MKIFEKLEINIATFTKQHGGPITKSHCLGKSRSFKTVEENKNKTNEPGGSKS